MIFCRKRKVQSVLPKILLILEFIKTMFWSSRFGPGVWGTGVGWGTEIKPRYPHQLLSRYNTRVYHLTNIIDLFSRSYTFHGFENLEKTETLGKKYQKHRQIPFTKSMWYLICDMWYAISDMWYVICDMWYVICDMIYLYKFQGGWILAPLRVY